MPFPASHRIPNPRLSLPKIKKKRKRERTNSLSFKRLDRLDLLRRIDSDGLELLDGLLELIDNGRVLEDGPVVGEVDLGRLGELGELAVRRRGFGRSLSEGVQGGDGVLILFCLE